MPNAARNITAETNDFLTTDPDARLLLRKLKLRKLLSPLDLPQEALDLIDAYSPTCDSLLLKKQLLAIQQECMSVRNTTRALNKIVELCDSNKPEVARRACMTILKFAQLDTPSSILPREPTHNTRTPTPTPPKPAVSDGAGNPPPAKLNIENSNTPLFDYQKFHLTHQDAHQPIENQNSKLENPPLHPYHLTTPFITLQALHTLLILILIFLSIPTPLRPTEAPHLLTYNSPLPPHQPAASLVRQSTHPQPRSPRMNRRTFLKSTTTLALAYSLPNISFAKETPGTPPAPQNPNLLLNADGLAALRTRIHSQPWAYASWSAILQHVNKALTKPIELPPRGGNWSHNYVCPIHGSRLHQGKQLGPWRWQHICPTGPHILLGDPSKATTDFDGNGIMNVHLDNADLLTECGLVYHLENDDGVAAYARQLLLAYADKYTSYPLHDNKMWPGKGAHVASQPLTEASWLIGMAHGADLIWPTLSPDEKAKCKDGLFYAAVNQILLPSKLAIHNIQCRINAAIGLVGFLYNDPKLIDTAINDKFHGFRTQIAKGVHDDGMWTEGSTGYHFFTIDGLWPLTEAARNHGIDLYSDRFRSMFDGPIQLARPDNVLPNFNDSGDSPLASHAPDYELALARWGNPEYAAIIRASTKTRLRAKGAESDDNDSAPPRQNRMALLFGVHPLPADDTIPPRTSHNDTASGYAIIQRGKGEDATWLCIKYGPHGGGHGHPDKNHFILYTRKFVLCPDAGTHAYGSPLHLGWDKTTAAHNTLIADEKSQTPAEGKSLAFGASNGVDYSISHAGPIYKGIDFIRTAALIDENLIVFIDQITSDTAHTYDLTYHQVGQWKDLPTGENWTPPAKTPGYAYFKSTTTRTTDKGITLTTTHKHQSIPASVVLAAGPETEIITGTGILQTTEDLVPMVMLRRKAKSTTYVWAISLDATPITLEHTSPNTAKVTRNGKSWTLAIDPGQKSLTALVA
ncbi:MAG: heparinase II/III domain-containing protein [Phycisphaerae bacterium]